MDSPHDPTAALARLVEGNARFVSGRSSMQRVRETATREARARLAHRQQPFATIVSCSDSRVPAEIIFDQGLGDLFIVRNAGAVMGYAPLASIEFAVSELSTPLVVVLAHEGCGAFRAAHAILSGDPVLSQSLGQLVSRLRPALVAAGEGGGAHERCERAARIHARRAADAIASSPVAAPLIAEGKVRVISAYYRLESGRVEFDCASPEEAARLARQHDAAGEVAHDAA